jgi:ribosomal protein L7/L12
MFGQPLRQQERRLKAVQRKLDLVMDQLGVEEPPLSEVERALQQGKRLRAIAAYRRATGANLTEARDAVDAMARKGGG